MRIDFKDSSGYLDVSRDKVTGDVLISIGAEQNDSGKKVIIVNSARVSTEQFEIIYKNMILKS